MTGLYPIDNGFGRHITELTGLENGQYVFHRNAPFIYSGCRKNVAVFKRFFSTTPYAAIPYLGVFKPGAEHPVTHAPVKALPCLCIFGAYADKIQATRFAGGR
jgi:hypothetical protein